jgi:chromosome segregation ATPase
MTTANAIGKSGTLRRKARNIMNYDLQQLNEQIADTLSGNGDFEQLKRLEAQKRDILHRRHFERLGELREQIKQLRAERETAFLVRDDLQADLTESGNKINAIRAELESVEAGHRETTARLFYLDSTIDGNRKTIAEIERELDRTIKNKIKDVTTDE